MSVNYSAGLSPYEDKGVCGLPEVIDDPDEIEEKISSLKDLIVSSSLVTVHCGAGISTSCGIPDFRGPKGVWTLELKSEVNKEDEHSMKACSNQGKTIDTCISFEDSKPSFTHRALAKLASSGYIHHIISQNVDGLFLKTGLERKFLSELHGNFFLDECDLCQTRFIRMTSSPTMGLKLSSRRCQRPTRPCRGHLRDTILDWEDNLPEQELSRAQEYSRRADLSICLGTSLQIVPAAQLPFWCKKSKLRNGKVVIINLQSTKFDHKADLVIHDYVDIVMKKLCESLNIDVPEYSEDSDLTISEKRKSRVWE